MRSTPRAHSGVSRRDWVGWGARIRWDAHEVSIGTRRVARGESASRHPPGAGGMGARTRVGRKKVPRDKEGAGRKEGCRETERCRDSIPLPRSAPPVPNRAIVAVERGRRGVRRIMSMIIFQLDHRSGPP
jgi:hypothetical protein